jgi:hypothetical protein
MHHAHRRDWSRLPAPPRGPVGVQRGKDVVQEFPADGSVVTWQFDAQRVGTDVRDPYVHGRPGDRFIYLSWQRQGSGMFRRAKLMLDGLPPDLLAEAEQGALTARVSLAMPDGSPLCAAVRAPHIEWRSLDG